MRRPPTRSGWRSCATFGAVLLAALPALLGCDTTPAAGTHPGAAPPTAPARVVDTPTPTSDGTPASPASTRSETAEPAWPAFSSSVRGVSAADLPHSWHLGCPTSPQHLRALTLSYVDFAGHSRLGTLVVNTDAVAALTAVFADLYAHRYPIRRMVPVDAYGGSDARSTAADNTAGFNCRAAVSAGPPSWSEHAYGEAVDVDPVENPYLEGGQVLPPGGAPYADRADVRPGMAEPGGELVTAFARQGWRWGAGFGDYQHFSVNGK